MESPESCSRCWDAADIPAWGTAPEARVIVAVEQPGPWGRKALTESGLDPDLGRALESAASTAGGKAVLIRRVGRHADPAPGERVVYVGGPDWLLRRTVADPAALPGLPWGDPDALRGLGFKPADPVLLVCSNGRRDVCCAVRGRPVAAAVSRAFPGQAYEASHLNGHRFAPTALLLPSLLMLARLDARLAVEVMAAARRGELASGILGPRHDRGLAWLPQPAQAAEAFARAEWRECDPAALRLEPLAPDRYAVTHRDGRCGSVRVERRGVGAQITSCGKPPAPQTAYAVTWTGD